MYISPNGDTLKGFLESQPADSAFFNIIYRYMNSHTISGSRRLIGDYSGTEGATWGEMRRARKLPIENAPRDLRPRTVSGVFDTAKIRLVELGDA